MQIAKITAPLDHAHHGHTAAGCPPVPDNIWVGVPDLLQGRLP